MPKHVKFKNWLCTITKSKYMNNDRIALLLRDVKTGEQIATATVNVVDYSLSDHLEKTHTFIKDYGENQGILKSLVEQGIVKDTGVKWPTGYVEANLVEVLI